MSCFKKCIIVLFLLFSAGTNLHLLSQEPLDLEILWQKEVFPKEIEDAKFSKDGKWIYVSIGSTIEKISSETGEFVSKFDNSSMSKGVGLLDISEIGNFIVTYDYGPEVNLWDTRLEKAIKHFTYVKTPGMDGIRAVAISPDEKNLIFSTNEYVGIDKRDWFIIVYDIQLDKEIKKIPVNVANNVVKFSHDGKYFATGGWYTRTYDGKQFDQVILWSTETWAPVDTIENLEGQGSGYRWIKFSKNDKYLSIVRATPFDGRIYDLKNYSILKNLSDNCSNIEVINDSLFLIYYFGRNLEIQNLNLTIKKYNYLATILESNTKNDMLSFFCGGGKNPIIMLTKEPIGVETDPIINEGIFISDSDNNLVIQTNNIFANNLLVEISDLQGKVVLSEILQNNIPNNKILFSVNLNFGVYICKITADDKSYTHKFQIVR